MESHSFGREGYSLFTTIGRIDQNKYSIMYRFMRRHSTIFINLNKAHMLKFSFKED